MFNILSDIISWTQMKKQLVSKGLILAIELIWINVDYENAY